MALPRNVTSTAGTAPNTGTGVRNVITVAGTAPNQTWSSNGVTGTTGSGVQSGSFASGSNAAPGGGSGSFSFGIFGKPEANGIEKALGALGTGLALINAASSIVAAGEGVLKSISEIGAAAKAFGDSLFSDAKAQAEDLLNDAKGNGEVVDPKKSSSANVKPLKGDWRVRIGVTNLTSILAKAGAEKGYLGPLTRDGKNSVVFPYTPTISVIHKGNYVQQSPVHNNFTFQSYKNSAVDDIVINGNFTVQNEEEGKYWLAATRFFKVLTKSFYGESFPNGMPPVVAQLYGYGDHMFGGSKGGVNIVVKSVTIELAKNVQYKRILYNGAVNYVPLDSNISLTVSPVFNRAKLRQFNLNDYANGGQTGIL